MAPANDRPQHDRCHLFLIPGEIRNTIYEYVLTKERAIRLERRGNDSQGKWYNGIASIPGQHDMSTLASSLSDALLEVNQLRFVNKQLYAETRGLALRYNDMSCSAAKDITEFLEHCAPSHLCRIRLLTLPWADLMVPSSHAAVDWQPLLRFCGDFPKARVNVELTSLRPDSTSALLFMALHQLRVRGTHTLINAIFKDGCGMREAFLNKAQELVHDDLSLGPTVRHQSIRYFANAEGFSEQGFRRVVEADQLQPGHLNLGTVNGGVEGLVHLMKQVIEHGV